MSEIRPEELKKYLARLFGARVELLSVTGLGGEADPEKALKEYGYGTPMRIDIDVSGVRRRLVFNTVRPGAFGHDTMPDRAAILLWEAHAFNTLPRHAPAVDVGAVTTDGSMKTLGDVKEPFILTEFVEGRVYREDLDRIKETGRATPLDHDRVRAMARYLAELHAEKRVDPGYYERRNRELLGHNECIFGLTDSYPSDHEWIRPKMLEDIEKKCVEWRWRNKPLTHRLSRVHGDFHPFNVLFREGTDFTVLDRSRGEYGDPADDLGAMSINYLFWGLMHSGEFREPFRGLWDTFYSTYLDASGDEELLSVIPPYLSWRALIVGSPVWYRIDEGVRRKLINFARNVLGESPFDWRRVEHLLGDRN
jgi:tRNA A-37 threonylcarbamoyl transferase component Bud32